MALYKMAQLGISGPQQLQDACSLETPHVELGYLCQAMDLWVHAGFVSEDFAARNGWNGRGGSYDQDGGGHGMGGGRRPGGPGEEHGMSSGRRRGGPDEHMMGGGRHPGRMTEGPGIVSGSRHGGREEYGMSSRQRPGRMWGGPGMASEEYPSGMGGRSGRGRGRRPGGMGGGRYHGGAGGRRDYEDMYYGSGSDDGGFVSEDGYESGY